MESFFWRWYHRLSSPFTREDLRAGFTYALAFRLEISDTRVFTQPPRAGSAFFEGVIRDHLDLARPDQVSLTFDRRVSSRTPGTFRTRVITRGVDPSGKPPTSLPASNSTSKKGECSEPKH